MKNIFVVLCFLLFILGTAEKSLSQSKEETLEWFGKLKFGMFIHWGVYSEIGRNEWARAHYKMSIEEYQEYVDRFNPVTFNPDEWVDLAKEAGMKYMVFTSKHHDGFCMFDSKLQDYNIMNSSYGKDIVGMLNNACKKNDMPLGLYYSIREWYHPDYIQPGEWAQRFEGLEPAESPFDDSPNLDRYVDFVKGHLSELVTQYDPPIIWFDGTSQHTLESIQSWEIIDHLNKIKPEIIHNDRVFPRNEIWKYEDRYFGDFFTPERSTPTAELLKPDGTLAPWEACNATQFNAWGYNRYETQFHTTTELIQALVSVVSKGGNYLLNVGPQPDGKIRGEDIIRLKAIGEWLKINGEAIYETSPGCFGLLPFYGKSTVKGNTIYVHIFEWPKNNVLHLPGLKSEIENVYLLANKDVSLQYERSGNDVFVKIPDSPPCQSASVLAIKLESPPDVEIKDYIIPETSGSIKMPVHNADIISIATVKGYLEHDIATGRTAFINWKKTYTTLNHKFVTEEEGKYRVKIIGSSPGEGSTYVLTVDETEIEGKLGLENEVFISDIHLTPGKHSIKLQFTDIKGEEAFRFEEFVLEIL